MNDTPRSLVEHLSELRSRIIYVLLAVVIGICAGLVFAEDLFLLITRDAGPLIQFNPIETFLVHLRIGVLAGIVIAVPVLLYQVAAFLLPALTRSERILLWSLLPGMIFLFATGWLFGWFIVVPITRNFVIGYATGVGVVSTLTPRTYVDFILGINNPLGIAFELPLVVVVLARIGLISAAFLRRFRKYAILVVFILAAILSPPTVIDQVLLAIPMMFLYEVSIWLAKLVEKRTKR